VAFDDKFQIVVQAGIVKIFACQYRRNDRLSSQAGVRLRAAIRFDEYHALTS